MATTGISITGTEGQVRPALPVRVLRNSRRFAARKPLGAIGAVLIAFMIIVAVLAPVIAGDPLSQRATDRLQGPSGEYWFGTDNAGRDIYSRTVWGSRTSLQVGIAAVSVGLGLGIMFGLISGYMGGPVDLTLQRVMDSMMAFPPLVLAMLIAGMFGNSIVFVMLAIGLVYMPSANRVMRGTVLSIKPQQFVEAARCVGATDLRIAVRHVLPNIMAPAIILGTAGLGNAILLEAGLSFLGLGTPPPLASWGRELSGAGRAYFETAPWMALAPGMAITLAVLGFNLLGDALRDVLDPRMRGS